MARPRARAFLLFTTFFFLPSLSLTVPLPQEVPVTWNEIEGSKLDVLSSTVQMARDIFAIRACYSSGLWSDKHVESTPEETGKKPAEHVTPQ